MFGVEHFYAKDDRSTYEIFPTLAEAKTFCSTQHQWSENHYPLHIFKADFKSELVFQEESGQWNYEDFSNTVLNYHDFLINLK